ncbi:MAG: hypothetical protein J1E58_00790 [Prevotella sp.]|nr:hypothetical protein [Prevotella sp.]
MKYTTEEIGKMSWQQWNEVMAKELNDGGFKAKEFNKEVGRWTKTGQYSAGNEPKLFVLGTIEDSCAISYLKKLGLLNNGRCPMCGASIYGNPGRFTSGYDPDYHFQICQNCVNTRGGMRRHSSSGCIIALLLFPWYLVKNLF